MFLNTQTLYLGSAFNIFALFAFFPIFLYLTGYLSIIYTLPNIIHTHTHITVFLTEPFKSKWQTLSHFTPRTSIDISQEEQHLCRSQRIVIEPRKLTWTLSYHLVSMSYSNLPDCQKISSNLPLPPKSGSNWGSLIVISCYVMLNVKQSFVSFIYFFLNVSCNMNQAWCLFKCLPFWLSGYVLTGAN